MNRSFKIRSHIIAYTRSLALNANRLNWYEVRFHDVERSVSFARTQHLRLAETHARSHISPRIGGHGKYGGIDLK